MTIAGSKSLSFLFKTLLLILMASFFLSLTFARPGHLLTRMILSGVWAGVALIFLGGFKARKPSLLVFGSFVLFELVRALLFFIPGLASDPALKNIYLQAPLYWGLYFAGFWAALTAFSRKSFAMFFISLSAVLGFLLAIYLIPLILQTGQIFIKLPSGVNYFFPPSIYFASWVEEYAVARVSHSNRLGDMIAIGFFSSLSLLFYYFLQFKDRIKNAISYMERPNSQEWSLFFLFISFSLVTGAAILLLFSRGTIVCVAAVFLLSFLAIAVKFPSKSQWFFLFIILAVGLLFFSWAGNLQNAWKEVGTLKEEQRVIKDDLNKATDVYKSIYDNQEGAKRALKIFKDHVIWGVGTNGYPAVSKKYSSGGKYDNLRLAPYTAVCFYLQLLAEEGIGAGLFFVFLLFYLIELTAGMFQTKSQFKFLAALSFAAPAVTILLHAGFNDLMQRFTVAMPVFILMGASLAVLRKDFQHDA